MAAPLIVGAMFESEMEIFNGMNGARICAIKYIDWKRNVVTRTFVNWMCGLLFKIVFVNDILC